MQGNRTSKIHTLTSALQKARKYCAYQERSQQEVRDKLYDLGLHRKDVEQGISLLVEEGFINEQRFAIAFAGGKFRVNRWGKVKIKLALKSKKVSDYCIRAALGQINDKDYLTALERVISIRSGKVKEPDPVRRNYLVAQYAIGRGFEPDLVWEALKMNE